MLDFDDYEEGFFDPVDVEMGKSKSIYRSQLMFRNK